MMSVFLAWSYYLPRGHRKARGVPGWAVPVTVTTRVLLGMLYLMGPGLIGAGPDRVGSAQAAGAGRTRRKLIAVHRITARPS